MNDTVRVLANVVAANLQMELIFLNYPYNFLIYDCMTEIGSFKM